MVHRTTCRVIYGDTDRMGQAYYGNYFRWFEVGRTELFRAVGLPYKEIEERGFFLPVSECRAKYHTPALYDEVLVIETAVDDSVKGGIKFDYRIYPRRRPDAAGRRLHQACLCGPHRPSHAAAGLHPRTDRSSHAG